VAVLLAVGGTVDVLAGVDVVVGEAGDGTSVGVAVDGTS
jgi:hypothetical protein